MSNTSGSPAPRKIRILVIEDDEDVRDPLVEMLRYHHYSVDVAADGEEGLRQAIAHPPDVILLDAMMPKLDGFQTVEAMRLEPSIQRVPILMLTALKDVPERIRAFKLGADDYIVKPFDKDELLARIESKLRRTQELMSVPANEKVQLKCGNLMLDLKGFEARLNQEVVRLSLLEFRFVRYLIDHLGQLCKREEILRDVWESTDKSERILDAHVLALRKKLAAWDHTISSVYGGGYLLREPASSGQQSCSS